MRRRQTWSRWLPPRSPWEASEWRRRRRSTELWTVTTTPTGRAPEPAPPRLLHGYQSSPVLRTIWESRWDLWTFYAFFRTPLWEFTDSLRNTKILKYQNCRRRLRRRRMRSVRLRGSWEESLTSWASLQPPPTASSPWDDIRPVSARTNSRKTRTTQTTSADSDTSDTRVCPGTLLSEIWKKISEWQVKQFFLLIQQIYH